MKIIIIKNIKKICKKKHVKDNKTFLKRKKQKAKKMLKTDLSEEGEVKKRQYYINMIRPFLRNKSKNKLSIWEIIIQHIKKYLLTPLFRFS